MSIGIATDHLHPAEALLQKTALSSFKNSDLIKMLKEQDDDGLRELTKHYLSLKDLDCSAISSPIALEWQSRLADEVLAIEGDSFPFSNSLDCSYEELRHALGGRRSLELVFITPTARSMNSIFELIKSGEIHHLKLQGFLISDADVEVLLGLILSSQNLKSITLENLRLSTQQFIHLSQAIEKSPSIETVVLRSNSIKEEAVPYLRQMIVGSTSLRKISLTLDQYDKLPSLESLKGVLRDNQTIDLSDNWGY